MGERVPVVSRQAERIRIGLSRRRPGPGRRPADRRPERRQGGFGLSIVAELAQRRDVEHREDTTETWFEL